MLGSWSETPHSTCRLVRTQSTAIAIYPMVPLPSRAAHIVVSQLRVSADSHEYRVLHSQAQDHHGANFPMGHNNDYHVQTDMRYNNSWFLGLGAMFCAQLMLLGGASLAHHMAYLRRLEEKTNSHSRWTAKGGIVFKYAHWELGFPWIPCCSFGLRRSPFLSVPWSWCQWLRPQQFSTCDFEWRSYSTHVNLKHAGPFESGTLT